MKQFSFFKPVCIFKDECMCNEIYFSFEIRTHVYVLHLCILYAWGRNSSVCGSLQIILNSWISIDLLIPGRLIFNIGYQICELKIVNQ